MSKQRSSRLDIVLLIVIPLLLVGALLLFGGLLYEKGETRPLEYTLLFEGAKGESEALAAAIPVGCAVYSSNGTAHLGTVTDVAILSHRVPVVPGGKVVFADAPECRDIRVTVRAEGRYFPTEGFRVSELRILGGARGDFYAGGYFGVGVILCVDEVEQ